MGRGEGGCGEGEADPFDAFREVIWEAGIWWGRSEQEITARPARRKR